MGIYVCGVEGVEGNIEGAEGEMDSIIQYINSIRFTRRVNACKYLVWPYLRSKPNGIHLDILLLLFQLPGRLVPPSSATYI